MLSHRISTVREIHRHLLLYEVVFSFWCEGYGRSSYAL